MSILMNAWRRARPLALAVFLASCGGGGGSTSTVTPAAGFPGDFTSPYFIQGATDDTVFLVAADGLDTPVQVAGTASGHIVASEVIAAGEWSNGEVSSIRPAQFAYAQGNQWYRIDLRAGTTATPVAFGDETAEICLAQSLGLPSSLPDYANPGESWIFYTAAAPGSDCNSPTEQHALRLDASTATAPVRLPPPLRLFYDTSGGISGFVVAAGADLRYYDKDLANFTPLVTNVSRINRAGVFARTADTIYVSYQDPNTFTSYVDRVNSDGTLGAAHLFSLANAKFSSGYSDAAALYVESRPQTGGGTTITRVPYDGSASTPLYSSTDLVELVGATIHAVIGIDYGLGDPTLVAIEKNTGATVHTLATATNDFLPPGTGFGPWVLADRVVWTAYDGFAGGGTFASSRAGITLDSGIALEEHANSRWLSFMATSSTFAQPRELPLAGAVLLRDYDGTADYPVNGDLGATVVSYDFDLLVGTTIRTVDTVPAPLTIDAPTWPVGLASLLYLASSGRTDSDVLSFDLPRQATHQVTDTPTISELVPLF